MRLGAGLPLKIHPVEKYLLSKLEKYMSCGDGNIVD